MDNSPFKRLPEEVIYMIFSILSIDNICNCKLVCKQLCELLSSPNFLQILASRSLAPQDIPLSPKENAVPILLSNYCFDLFNLNTSKWLTINLSCLPFHSLQLISASCLDRVYLWGVPKGESTKTLLVCNPVTKEFKYLPQLGSAWLKHGKVMGFEKQVLVLTPHAALYLSISEWKWMCVPLSFRYKLKCPVLYPNSIVALCEVETQWKLHQCILDNDNSWSYENLVLLGGDGFAETLDEIKSPRLVRGRGDKLIVTGELKSRNNPEVCETIVIRRLSLDTLTWEPEIKMPESMFNFFRDLRYTVFGRGDKVVFALGGRRVLWDANEGLGGMWSLIKAAPDDAGDKGKFKHFCFQPTIYPLF